VDEGKAHVCSAVHHFLITSVARHLTDGSLLMPAGALVVVCVPLSGVFFYPPTTGLGGIGTHLVGTTSAAVDKHNREPFCVRRGHPIKSLLYLSLTRPRS